MRRRFLNDWAPQPKLVVPSFLCIPVLHVLSLYSLAIGLFIGCCSTSASLENLFSRDLLILESTTVITHYSYRALHVRSVMNKWCASTVACLTSCFVVVGLSNGFVTAPTHRCTLDHSHFQTMPLRCRFRHHPRNVMRDHTFSSLKGELQTIFTHHVYTVYIVFSNM